MTTSFLTGFAKYSEVSLLRFPMKTFVEFTTALAVSCLSIEIYDLIASRDDLSQTIDLNDSLLRMF